MCNKFANKATITAYRELLTAADLKLAESLTNLQPREEIWPTNQAPVLRPVEGGLQIAEMRFGLIPWFHKKPVKEWKPLTTNARSETVTKNATYRNAFQKHRCLIPFSHFSEWTGEKGHKTEWHFKPSNYEWLAFAGIWEHAHTVNGQLESFAMLTMPAGPDVKAIHDRQPVILEPENFKLWLDPTQSAAKLLEEPKAGLLRIEKI